MITEDATKKLQFNIQLLELHRSNLLSATDWATYRDHHVAYIDMLIQQYKSALSEEVAVTKFVYRTAVASPVPDEFENQDQP